MRKGSEMIDRLIMGFLSIGVAAVGTSESFAAGGHTHAPYAGQQKRVIKTLSVEDIEALQQGRGWGFAKPAELNGYPGPLHVLELNDKLGLSAVQRTKIQAIFVDMKAAAQKVGRDYLAAGQALDAAFAKGSVTAETISVLTQAAARLRAELQSVHLRAHLLTTPLLSKTQLHRYAVLRGYTDGGSHVEHGKGSHGGHQ